MNQWISVKDRLPTGYDIVDADDNYVEPAEYIVHVAGAELATTAMFNGKEFVKSLFCNQGSFNGEIDYWMELPKPPERGAI